jgi:short-subunit dehydrogenase
VSQKTQSQKNQGQKIQGQKIIVLGATSKIAQEIARLAAADHKELLVVARNPERLAAVAGDLAARGASRAESIAADLGNIAAHPALVNEILAKMPDFDTVLLAYGTLSDQARAEDSAEYALAELNTNFTSAVSLLTRLSNVLSQRRGGCIAIITSGR